MRLGSKLCKSRFSKSQLKLIINSSYLQFKSKIHTNTLKLTKTVKLTKMFKNKAPPQILYSSLKNLQQFNKYQNKKMSTKLTKTPQKELINKITLIQIQSLNSKTLKSTNQTHPNSSVKILCFWCKTLSVLSITLIHYKILWKSTFKCNYQTKSKINSQAKNPPTSHSPGNKKQF